MSNWRLIRTNGAMIPGGYQFSDPITGKQYRDMENTFEQRVRQIVHDRNANRRLFTDTKFVDSQHVAKELSEAQCARLKNNRLFCTDGLPIQFNQPVNYTAAPAPKGKVCRYCKSDQLEEVLCPTCSGKKRTGWRCLKCGKESPL